MSLVRLPEDKGWTRLGPGGGGSMFNPTVSPHDAKTAILTCDMTGQYVTRDGGRSWSMGHLMIWVDCFAFDPVDPQRIYAGANALFATDDLGQTWRMIWPGAEGERKTILIGDEASARYRGGNWPERRVSALAVDRENNRRLFVGVSGSHWERGTEAEVFLSEDRGASWRKLVSLAGQRLHRLAINPVSPDTVWAITSAQVCRSEDGGATWTQISFPSGNPLLGGDLGFDAEGRTRLYVITSPTEDSPEAGLYVSEDGGGNWRFAGAGVPTISPVRGWGGAPVKAVGVCRDHPEVAYLATSASRIGPEGGPLWSIGVAKTTDGGRTWEWAYRVGEKREPRPGDSDWEGGFDEAENYEQDWLTKSYGSFWCDFPFGLGVAPTDPDYCYATDMGRAYMTADGGKQWRGMINRFDEDGGAYTSGLDVTTCYGVHFDPHHPDVCFISYTDIGLFKSFNRGRTWHHRIAGTPRPWINTCYWLTFDPEIPDKVWSVWSSGHDYPRLKMFRHGSADRFRGGVCVSEDNGETWRPTMAGLPEVGCTQIVLDPTSPAGNLTLYVVGFGRGVCKSTDDGRSWRLCDNGLPENNRNAWWLSGDPAGTMYLLIFRDYQDGKSLPGGLYRTTDGAETWERLPISDEIPAPNDLCVAPDDPEVMYAAAWPVTLPDQPDGRLANRVVEGGVFKTIDGGLSWERLPFPGQYVYGVTIDPREPGVIYATAWHEGVFRSENGGRTHSLRSGQAWARLGGANFGWPHRVIPDPFDPEMIYLTTFGASLWHGPTRGTPGAGPDIVDLPEVREVRP